jgi:hypothetical protein
MISTTLLLKFWQPAAIVALIGFGAVEWHAHNVAEQEKGAALVLNHSLDSTLKAIKPALGRVDTVLVRDTVRVKHAVDRLVTFRDTVLSHITDTLIVQQFVARADSAAKVCTELSTDCAEYRRLTTIKIAALESKLAIAPLVTSSHHWTADLLKFGAGFGLGYLAHR